MPENFLVKFFQILSNEKEKDILHGIAEDGKQSQWVETAVKEIEMHSRLPLVVDGSTADLAPC